MPAYDTPPPPPVHLLREQPRRSGPLILVLGLVFVAALAVLFGFRLSRIEAAAAPFRKRSIIKTAKLAKATLLYAEDNDGQFPATFDWQKSLKRYGVTAADLQSPLDYYHQYAFRRGAGNQKGANLIDSSKFVLFFDYYGRGTTMPTALEDAWSMSQYRQKGDAGNVYSFADGHAAFVAQRDWDPADLDQGPIR